VVEAARGGGADLVGQPGEHGGTGVPHVGHGPLLFAFCKASRKFGMSSAAMMPMDGDDDQQLDQRKAPLPIPHSLQHYVLLPASCIFLSHGLFHRLVGRGK